MKIAIIYTGEIRTIQKTIKHFKKNCLINNDIHVFAVLQNNDLPGDKLINLVSNEFGKNLKSIELFNKNDICFCSIRDKLIQRMNIPDEWKSYLQNSGSIIEYYQGYLAYFNIVKTETTSLFEYDYIIRIRCDCIITKPLNFNWCYYNKNTVIDFLHKIKNHYSFNSIINEKIISIFMDNLLDNNRFLLKENITRQQFCKSQEYKNLFSINDETTFINEFYNYFKKGKYMITLRANIIYLIKRSYYTRIYSLGVTYGLNKTIPDDYWFNAESQLVNKCLENNIDIYDSTTTKEATSLYNYETENYFTNNELELLEMDDVYYFLLRK